MRVDIKKGGCFSYNDLWHVPSSFGRTGYKAYDIYVGKVKLGFILVLDQSICKPYTSNVGNVIASSSISTWRGYYKSVKSFIKTLKIRLGNPTYFTYSLPPELSNASDLPGKII